MNKIKFLLFAAFLAACSPVSKYRSLPEVKAWNNEIMKFERLDSAETHDPNSLLFTGSSSIRLWSDIESDMAPYPVIQRGYGGAKLSDFVVYTSRIIDHHQCSAILIFVANDITGDKGDKTPRETAALFKGILRIIRKTHPETPVFWIEVTPTPLRWKVWPEIMEAGALIREICMKNSNTYYLPTKNEFLNSKGRPIPEYYRSDSLHLTRKGYEVWREIIKKELKKIVPMPETEIIAHRGASYEAPENTLASARLAWEKGAEAVECDIFLSADNKIIVSHDPGTKRVTGKDYIIAQTNSDILRTLDAGAWKDEKYTGEKLPFLDELIETVPDGKKLVIEVKCGSEVIPYLKETLALHGGNKKFDFIGFDFSTITEVKKAFPDNNCYWLCSDRSLLERNFDLIPEAGLDGISLNFRLINREVADKALKLGLRLYSWTVDDPAEAKRLLTLHVNGITTNRAAWLKEQTGIE